GRALRARELDLGRTGLLGLAVLAIAGTLVHLVAPVRPWVGGAAFAIGLVLFVRNARTLLRGTAAATWIAMGLALAALAFASDYPQRHYDMGLYWLQSVRWVTDSPQQLGIAALQVRFGFNSIWFTVCAMLEHPLAEGQSGSFAIALVSIFGAWIAADGVRDVVDGRRTFAAWLAASTALLVAACMQHLGGHSADGAVAVLGFVAVVSWARAFERDEAFEANARLAIVLAAFAFAVKISAAIWLAAAPALLLLRSRRAWREVVPAVWVTAALLVPWVVTGYLASGCPLYPSTFGCLPFPWTTPEWVGVEHERAIRGWARNPWHLPDRTLGNWAWVPAWAGRTLEDGIVRLLAAALVAGAAGVALVRRPASPGFWALAAVALAGLGFWFVGAPTPRFGWAYLFAIALAPASEAAARLAALPRRWIAGALGAVAIAGAVGMAVASLGWMRQVPWEKRSPISWPELPFAHTKEMRSSDGLTIRLPMKGDQCWSAPPPCTTHLLAPGLKRDGRMFWISNPDVRF
ncbi:MAG TPA: hypothetical protein VIW03_09660, partial [Anaeromyxobacter sp.]